MKYIPVPYIIVLGGVLGGTNTALHLKGRVNCFLFHYPPASQVRKRLPLSAESYLEFLEYNDSAPFQYSHR